MKILFLALLTSLISVHCQRPALPQNYTADYDFVTVAKQLDKERDDFLIRFPFSVNPMTQVRSGGSAFVVLNTDSEGRKFEPPLCSVFFNTFVDCRINLVRQIGSGNVGDTKANVWLGACLNTPGDPLWVYLTDSNQPLLFVGLSGIPYVVKSFTTNGNIPPGTFDRPQCLRLIAALSTEEEQVAPKTDHFSLFDHLSSLFPFIPKHLLGGHLQTDKSVVEPNFVAKPKSFAGLQFPNAYSISEDIFHQQNYYSTLDYNANTPAYRSTLVYPDYNVTDIGLLTRGATIISSSGIQPDLCYLSLKRFHLENELAVKVGTTTFNSVNVSVWADALVPGDFWMFDENSSPIVTVSRNWVKRVLQYSEKTPDPQRFQIPSNCFRPSLSPNPIGAPPVFPSVYTLEVTNSYSKMTIYSDTNAGMQRVDTAIGGYSNNYIRMRTRTAFFQLSTI